MAPIRSNSKGPKSSKPSFKNPALRVSKKGAKAPPPKQQKTKSKTAAASKQKKKRRVYTDEELGIPKLNMITPVGVQKPRGKKKGKVFVDDSETMQTILAMVNAEKEGQIESKMLRARQMEEIREAREKEAEAKEHQRKQVLESKKDEFRGRRNRGPAAPVEVPGSATKKSKPRKKVSFV